MVDSNMNEIWPTDGKHRITLIYLVEDDGFYGGGYYEPSVDLMGGVGGDSIAEMVNEAYASLERATKAVVLCHLILMISRNQSSLILLNVAMNTKWTKLTNYFMREKVLN
jgi:hypothetical protein